ncbi:MAG: hypothetical protein ACW9XB_07075 [Candidatus Nitrosopumilus sp. metabat.KBP569_Feb_25m_nospike.7]
MVIPRAKYVRNMRGSKKSETLCRIILKSTKKFQKDAFYKIMPDC